jgi:hypothetical protein
VRQNGEIYDPTKDQFPSYALPELYEEFDGYFRCETCGKRVAEQTARFAGSHPFCSYDCFCKGVYPA